ncbi:hypothetical protein [Mycolicibacterium sp. HS_4_1]
MTSVEEPESHSRVESPTVAESAGLESVTAAFSEGPFAGLLAFSDVVAAQDPLLGDVWTSVARLGRAVLDRYLPEWIREVAELFDMSPGHIDQLVSGERVNEQPFTAESFAEDVIGSIIDLTDEHGRELLADEGRALVAAESPRV